jgi:hypothetical protein
VRFQCAASTTATTGYEQSPDAATTWQFGNEQIPDPNNHSFIIVVVLCYAQLSAATATESNCP